VPTCSQCGNAVMSSARFCTRCGGAIRASAPRSESPRHPTAGGMPWAGILFLVGILFAPAAVFAGMFWHVNALLIAGLAAAVLMVLVVLLSMLF
jgi:hypothetical protein